MRRPTIVRIVGGAVITRVEAWPPVGVGRWRSSLARNRVLHWWDMTVAALVVATTKGHRQERRSKRGVGG